MMHASACTGFGQAKLSRRHLLKVGGLSCLGLGLPDLLRASSASPPIKARAKSVIFLHQFGGPSHVDTFDMKPAAPAEVRGEFKPISSKVPGLPVCELLPRMAGVMDKLCLVRSVYHHMKNHNSATYYSLTGNAPPLDDIRLRDSQELFPAYGSVVDRLSPAAKGMPTFVSYPYVLRDGSVTPGQHASFLGKAHDPLFISEDPNSSEFKLPELSLPESLSVDRLGERRSMMKLLDEQAGLLEYSARARGIDATYDKALGMLTTPRIKEAFDLTKEPAKLRDAYGRTTYGQSCLLARRLVEAGAKFINVYLASSIGGGSKTSGGWDTHGFRGNPMYPILREWLLPITDKTVPTLLEDLDQRGLLDETLVVWMGEFGRGPKINNMAGRDHWPQCYTMFFAGGGCKRGHAFGASDRIGAFPAQDAVRLDDIAATMFYLLGIDPATEIRDSLKRPLAISRGSAIMGVVQ